MRPRPLRVALTGGIATGKSHCQNLLVALGAPVVDADALAFHAIAPGTSGAAEVMSAFGTLDRTKLGQLVFKDAVARRTLEAIIHPRVYEGIENFFRGLKASAPFGIADIPLLFETGHEREYDRVIITSCRVEQQHERLVERGLTPAEADARIASQLPFEEKLARANAAFGPQMIDVIDTSGTFEKTDRQIVRIVDVLGSLPPRVCS
jgi:dephospho-CoA kinase